MTKRKVKAASVTPPVVTAVEVKRSEALMHQFDDILESILAGKVMPVLYRNEETGVVTAVCELAYIALRTLDAVEKYTPKGIDRIFQTYSTPKEQRAALVESWVANPKA